MLLPPWLETLIDNFAEVQERALSGDSSYLPPLALKSGISFVYSLADPVLYILKDIFIDEVYTGNKFYIPQPNDVVLDCGANIGLFALYLCGKEPRVSIHCFEPATDVRSRLIHNIDRNHLNATVAIHPLALSDCWGKQQFEHGSSTGEHRLSSNSNGIGNADVESETVDCVSLSEAIEISGADEIALLKMDIEGAEVAALKSLEPSTLRRIQRISLEFHNSSAANGFDEIIQVLDRCSFGIECAYSDLGLRGKVGIIRALRI